MKHQLIHIFLIFIILTAAVTTAYADATERRLHALEQQIDRKARVNENEAAKLLAEVDSISRKHPHDLTIRAHACLARAIFNERNGIRDSSLMREITEQLERCDDSGGRRALLTEALMLVQFAFGDFAETFETAIRLLNYAGDTDNGMCAAKALNMMGSACQLCHLFPMSEEYYIRALKYVTKGSYMEYVIRVNLLAERLWNKNGNKSIEANMQALRNLDTRLKRHGYVELLPALYNNIAKLLPTDGSIDYLKKSMQLYRGNRHKYALASFNIAVIYTSKKDDDAKAMQYLSISRKVWEDNRYWAMQYVYEQISSIYKRQGRLDSAFFYLDKSREIEHINDYSKRMIETSRKQIASALKQKETQLEFVRAENELKQKQLIISIVSLAAILFAAISVILILRHKKNIALIEMYRKEAENRELAASIEMEKEQTENKQREIASQSLLLASKNNILSQIKDTVDNFPRVDKSLRRQVRDIVKDNMQVEDEWNEFMLHFEQVHPRFFDRMRAAVPDITQSELRLAAYIRLGLSSKQIAQILNHSTGSVEVARSRLRKKMSLSKNDNLTQAIQDI